MTTLNALAPVSNDGAETIALSEPYAAEFTIAGTSALLLHRWSVEGVAEKAAAAKGSAAKKTDDVESYVWRLDNGDIGLPGEYVRQACIHAAKFRQDPRSPRKSAMDLYKAALVSLTELASLGTADWDYLTSGALWCNERVLPAAALRFTQDGRRGSFFRSSSLSTCRQPMFSAS